MNDIMVVSPRGMKYLGVHCITKTKKNAHQEGKFLMICDVVEQHGLAVQQ
jgi:hypothetical protein